MQTSQVLVIGYHRYDNIIMSVSNLNNLFVLYTCHFYLHYRTIKFLLVIFLRKSLIKIFLLYWERFLNLFLMQSLEKDLSYKELSYSYCLTKNKSYSLEQGKILSCGRLEPVKMPLKIRNFVAKMFPRLLLP